MTSFRNLVHKLVKNRKNIYLGLIIIIAIFLLICHVFSLGDVKVDNACLYLLVILLAIPFLSSIQKLKFGNIEAHIKSGEVNKAADSVNQSLAAAAEAPEPPPIKDYSQKDVEQLFIYFAFMVENNPVLCLASLRIELEKIIRAMYIPEFGENANIYNLHVMVHQLSQRKKIPVGISGALNDVVSICNKAIHGYQIEVNEAKSVTQMGISLMRYLIRRPDENPKGKIRPDKVNS